MSKTIEDVAREYADNAYYPAPDYGWYESDDEQMKECLSNAFKAGANHVYGLPLASRMTKEEKERVRKMYADIHYRAAYCKSKMSKTDNPVHITHHCNSMEFYVAQIKLLESIFGREFFVEGE